jgi:lipid A ethanolaminephosphotransferase
MFLQKLKTISSTRLAILLAVYFFLVLNVTLLQKLYSIYLQTEGLPLLFWISVPLFFVSAFTILFIPFIAKYITKPFFTILILTAAGVNYSTYQFGIIFNTDMITNIFETTTSEAKAYANPMVFVWLFLTGILPLIYLWWVKVTYKPFLREILSKFILFVVCLAIIGGIAGLYYKDYAAVSRNNSKIAKNIVPTYYVGSTYKYIKDRFFTKPLPYQAIGLDAKREDEDEKYLVVFMVGETARSQNYQLNGYDRPTNQYSKDIKNLISLRHVSSCGTATAISLPCMFSFLGHDNYSQLKSDAQDNVIDVLKRSNIKTTWVDNNTGCKGVCKNIDSFTSDEIISLDCKGEECTDDVFVDVLKKKVPELNGEDGIFFFHLIGSHGPTYYQRYPRDHAYFLPDCQTSDLQKCTDEEIQNSYDNTILYTDYVMTKLINTLKSYNDTYHTALIYVSDHGESLGEGGVYLHGMPYSIAPDYQKHVPFIMWMSDKMAHHKRLDMSCMKALQNQEGLSHDNLTPTLLHFMDVDTSAYDPAKDLLTQCGYK